MTKELATIKHKLKKHLMDVKELEEAVQYLFREQEHHHIIKSVITAGLEYVTLLDLVYDREIDLTYKDEFLAEVYQFVENTMNHFEAWLYLDESQRKEQISRLEEMRSGIIKRVNVLEAYENEIHVYNTLNHKKQYRNQMEAQEFIDIDCNYFSSMVVDFILSGEGSFVQGEKLRLILTELPVRITRQKFFDYITESMSKYYGGYINDLDNFINVLREAFYPKGVEGYGEYFTSFSEAIGEIEDSYLNGRIEDASDKLEQTGMKVEYLSNFCYFLISIINKLLVLLHRDNKIAKDYIKEEPDISRVIHLLKETKSISEKFKNTEKTGDFITEDMYNDLRLLEGRQEKWSELIDQYGATIQLMLDEYADAINDLGYKESIERYKLFEMFDSNNLFIEPDKYISDFTGSKQVDSRELSDKTKELIEFLDKKMKNMDINVRR